MLNKLKHIVKTLRLNRTLCLQPLPLVNRTVFPVSESTGQRKLTNRRLLSFIFVLSSFISFYSCTDHVAGFYDELNDRPEIVANYKAAYQVGDTMVINGRLNPDKDLTIRIGDADALIIAREKIPYGSEAKSSATTIDRVKLIITPEMGVGSGREVVVTSAGNSTKGSAIEIYSNESLIDYPLQLVQYHTLPSNAILLHCRNGKGNVYYWHPTQKSVYKVLPDGTAAVVFAPADWKDAEGDFTLSVFNGGGIDPHEEWLYFSAVVKDNTPENSTDNIFKISRFNLHSGGIELLNRTLYSKTTAKRTLDTMKPFEGNMTDVKIHQATAFYPDSLGNVYVRLGQYQYATGYLTVGGQFRYIFKSPNATILLPKVYNEEKGILYTDSEFFKFLPGLSTAVQGNISPDEHLMYYIGYNAGQLTQFDLSTQLLLYNFTTTNSSPTISGSFDILSGHVSSGGQAPARWGLMPFGEQSLMVLYYQGLQDTDFPAWGILDFKNKRGSRYAPGKLQVNNNSMDREDQLLNYDEDGMLYMTTNNKTVLVKTTKQ